MDTTTRALVLKAPETVSVSEVPLPEPRPGEVVLETLACGVSGSDLRYYVGDNPWSQHTLGRQEPVDWGRTILGHEVCARVAALGPEVDSLAVGDVVAVLPSRPCGECEGCRDGNANLCQRVSHLGHGGGWPEDYDRPHFPGAMSDRFVYFASSCFPVPLEKAEAEEFALAFMVAVAVHAVRRAERVRAHGLRRSGAPVLVVGCGQVGLSIAQAAAARGCAAQGVDPALLPREIAQLVGVPVAPDLMEAEGPFDAVFDTVCTAETITQSLNRLAPGGALVLLAPHATEGFGIPPLALGGERAVTTSCNFDPPQDFAEAIDLIASRKVDVRPYITRRVSLLDAPFAFARLHARRDADFKVVVQPEEG